MSMLLLIVLAIVCILLTPLPRIEDDYLLPFTDDLEDHDGR